MSKVSDTMVIPLYGRKLCSELYPELFKDEAAERLVASLDYDFSDIEKKANSAAMRFGALEVACRQTDLGLEVLDYLKAHPNAAVVNLGCGLDTTFERVDNGQCTGYNLDFPDMIDLRNELLPAGEREYNVPCDLNDFSWMDKIDASNGAVFFAAGVFYYFRFEELKKLFPAMEARFPGCVLAFDSCNKFGAKAMKKTFIKDAGITDVDAFFYTSDAVADLKPWFAHPDTTISTKGYMEGYQPLPAHVGKLAKVLAKVGDNGIKMQIVRVAFGGELPKPKVDKKAAKKAVSKAASSKATEEKKLYIPVLGKYFNQTRKPEGVLGKMMLAGMNSGHAKLADWGMQYLPELTVANAVDLGCGAGRNAGELAKRYKGAKVTAVDYSEESVKAAAKYNAKAVKAGTVTVQQGNVADLDLASGVYDLATAFETIYFWPGLEKSFSEVCRVLKPGGTFLITNESDGLDKTAQTFQKIIDGMNLYTAEEITAALKAAGFSNVECTHHKKNPWIAIVATK